VAVQSEPASPLPVRPAPASPAVSSSISPNYNYTYAGPDDAAPLQAYDNGKTTFIQYRTGQPLPSVYMIDSSGNTKSISYTIENDRMVIDMVAGEWRLENSNGTVYLYNEMLNPE
jgi:type IV secretion system protein VirB9